MVNYKMNSKIFFLSAHAAASTWLCFLWAWHLSVLWILSLIPSCAHSQTGPSLRTRSQASPPALPPGPRLHALPPCWYGAYAAPPAISSCPTPAFLKAFLYCLHTSQKLNLQELWFENRIRISILFCSSFAIWSCLWSIYTEALLPLSTNTNLVLVFHKLIISFSNSV